MAGLMRSVGRTLGGNVAVRAAKNLRNSVVDHSFRQCARGVGRRFAAELRALRIRHAAFAIAFDSPWVVDLLTRTWSRHQPDFPLVVIDNSADPEARLAHEDLCRLRSLPYLPLPWNPEWSPNRSHGIALNWVWFNVVCHADLDVAGFIDHDCIPVAAFDLRARMQDLDAYGLRGTSLTHPDAWNLWAGYCFLRPAAAARLAVDFKHRIEYGLDTGGGNWQGFYQWLAPDRVGAARCRWVRPVLGDDEHTAACMLLDEAFLHLEGASYRSSFRHPLLRRRLVEAIAERPLACQPTEPPGTPPMAS